MIAVPTMSAMPSTATDDTESAASPPATCQRDGGRRARAWRSSKAALPSPGKVTRGCRYSDSYDTMTQPAPLRSNRYS